MTEEKPKLYFCSVGIMKVIVPEKYITGRDYFNIYSSKAYTIETVVSNVHPPKGQLMNVGINIIETFNVHLKADLICDLDEKDPIYNVIVQRMNKSNGDKP